MSAKQQEETIKFKVASWVPELKSRYAHCLTIFIESSVLPDEIVSDTGEQMIRKAIAIGLYANNFLNPSWKDPTNFASGNALLI
jgi:hypothetical protein